MLSQHAAHASVRAHHGLQTAVEACGLFLQVKSFNSVCYLVMFCNFLSAKSSLNEALQAKTLKRPGVSQSDNGHSVRKPYHVTRKTSCYYCKQYEG